MRSAPRFQLVMMPSRVLAITASSEESTIDAKSAVRASMDCVAALDMPLLSPLRWCGLLVLRCAVPSRYAVDFAGIDSYHTRISETELENRWKIRRFGERYSGAICYCAILPAL